MMMHITRDVTTDKWYAFSTEDKMNAFTLAKGEGKFLGTSVIVDYKSVRPLVTSLESVVYIARSIKTDKWYAFSTADKRNIFTSSKENESFVVSNEEVDEHELGRNKMTKFQTYVSNATATMATENIRLGQALMNELPREVYEKYVGTSLDCFHDDGLVGDFLNDVYDYFQTVTVVNVWAKETKWVHRQVELNCSLKEARDTEKFESEDFEDYIVDYVDILDEEPCDDPTEWDLDTMVVA